MREKVLDCIAKETCSMDDDPNDIWIIKGNNYVLELHESDAGYRGYLFVDAVGDNHFVSEEELDEFFLVGD